MTDEEVRRRLLEALRSALDASFGRPALGPRVAFRAYLRSFARRAPALQDARTDIWTRRVRDEWLSILAGLHRRKIAHAMHDGVIPHADPDVMAWRLVAMLDAFATRFTSEPPDEQAIETFVGEVLQSLGIPAWSRVAADV